MAVLVMPDVEKVMVDYLFTLIPMLPETAQLKVGTQVASGVTPTDFIQVRHIGGTEEQRVASRPLVDVRVWAEPADRRSLVARILLAHMRRDLDCRTAATPIGLPDPANPSKLHTLFTIELLLRSTGIADPAGPVGGAGSPVQVRAVRKTTNEARTNTATPTADAQLLIPLVLPGTYLLDAELHYDASVGADCRFGWLLPPGSAIDWTPDGLSTSASSSSTTVGRQHTNAGTAEQVGAAGLGTQVTALPRGVVVITSTGTVALVWAQGVADPAASTLYAGSTLSLTKIA